jgi:hypothetical protein
MGSPLQKPRGPAESPPPAPSSDPGEINAYIGRIATELRQLAERSDLSFLAYLLSMVEEEALSAGRDRSSGRR